MIQRQEAAALDDERLAVQVPAVRAAPRVADEQSAQARGPQHSLERSSAKGRLGAEADFAAVPGHAAFADEHDTAGSDLESPLRPDLEERARVGGGDGHRRRAIGGLGKGGRVRSRLHRPEPRDRALPQVAGRLDRIRRGRASAGLPPRAAQGLLDLGDAAPGARHPQVFEGESQLPAHLVQEAEVEVAPDVAGRLFDRFAQFELRLGQIPRLEQDQAQVGAQHRRRRVPGQQHARRRGGLVVVAALELEQRDEIQHVLVAGPESSRLTQLVPGFLDLARPQASPRAVQVQQEKTLVDGSRIVGGAGHCGPRRVIRGAAPGERSSSSG